MKSYNEFMRTMKIEEDPDYDSTRFDRLMEWEGGSFDGFDDLSSSKMSSIVNFLESTNDYNRSKVVALINTNVDNINKVHKIVIDYEKSRQHEE